MFVESRRRIAVVGVAVVAERHLVFGSEKFGPYDDPAAVFDLREQLGDVQFAGLDDERVHWLSVHALA